MSDHPSRNVLVIMQARGENVAASSASVSSWHRISLEALAAGQQLAAALGTTCDAAILGSPADTDLLVAELARYQLGTIHAVSHDLLARYTADGWTSALAQLLATLESAYVVLPHTGQVSDFAPALATRLGQPLLSGVIAFHLEAGTPVFTRQWMQGKVNADIRPSSGEPCFVSVQSGSFRPDTLQLAATPATIQPFTPQLTAADIRTEPGEPFREAARPIDLATAPLLVSVGRGIGDRENFALVEDLAHALGAELVGSGPICDAGWLPVERWVGISGQTVAPRLYLAVGISGTLHHLLGMRKANTVVAINLDPNASIFDIADIAIVGDLFEIVPALIEKLTT